MQSKKIQTQGVEAHSGASPVSGPPSISDFTLLRPIGRGAYGEVWLARCVTGAYRAVKIVYRSRFEDEKPYEREFRGLLKFEPISRLHESQVDILHIGRNDDAGYFYYVMELADDLTRDAAIQPEIYSPRTLQTELAARGRLPVQECLRVGVTLATALEYLHSQGLTHRDIKPSNIIYVGAVPKLADVGLVAELAGTQTVSGTIGFAPPEGPGTVPADLYALGKVLYESAFGRDRNEFPELPAEIRTWSERDTLLELNIVLLKACERDPQNRYHDAGALRRDLELLLQGQSVAHKRSRERLRHFVLRAAAVLALSGLLGGLGWVVAEKETQRARDRTIHQHIAAGRQMLDDRDPGAALLFFAEALRRSDPTASQSHRFRCAAVLQQCPELLQIFPHSASVTTVAFSPDERRVLTGSEDGTARIWDSTTGASLIGPLTHSGPVLSATFSPNGDRVLTGSRDGMARLWNGATGEPRFEPMRHELPVLNAGFSPDGRRLFTVSARELPSPQGGLICLRDAETGARLAAKSFPGVRSLVFGSAGHRLLMAGTDGTACVLDADSLNVLLTIRCGGPLHLANFSPREDRIVTAGYDGVARIWNAVNGMPVSAPLRHSGPVIHAVFSFDGARLLTICKDQSIRLFKVTSGDDSLLWQFKTAGSPSQACWSADAHTVLLAHGDGMARLWKLPLWDPARLIIQHDGNVLHAEFSPEGRRLLTCGGESGPGHAALWEIASGRRLGKPMSHKASVIFASFSRDGRQIVTASPDKTARVWDALTGEPLTAPLRHDRIVWQADFSRDGSAVATASGENSLGEARIWSTQTGRLLIPPLQHPDDVMWVAFSPDGRLLATCGGNPGGEGRARVWQAVDGRPLTSWLPHSAQVWHICFSPDGTRVATAGLDQAAHLWDVTSGAMLCVLRHSGPVRFVRFAGDGRRVVTASLDKTARVWDCQSGKPLGPALDHVGPITDACFSPDERWVLTASSDGFLRVWDASTGEMVTPALHHGAMVHTVAFAPDSLTFVSAGGDGVARLWRLTDEVPPAQQLLAVAQAISGRRLNGSAGPIPLAPADIRASATTAVQFSRYGLAILTEPRPGASSLSPL